MLRFPGNLPLLLLLLVWAAPAAAEPGDWRDELSTLSLPEGFSISIYAEVPGARSLALGERTLFVGTRGTRVYAVRDLDRDGFGEDVLPLTEAMAQPNGVAFRGGDLYIAEIDRVTLLEDIEYRLTDPPFPRVVNDSFPEDRRHGWKYIAFGPDGWLYVPVGAPCNVCAPPEPYAALHRMRPDGSGLQTVARGIRNTVGFDWNPDTGVLWFTDNGRDWLGDERPPDELNRAAEAGNHYGYPYCFGKNTPDPRYAGRVDCSRFTPAQVELPAHVASLGMRFVTGPMFPESMRGDILIAEHGSWNRTTPIGYRVTRVRLNEDDEPQGYEPFISGWLNQETGQAWGRPVDLLRLPDGSMLLSDDEAGLVYRITYSP
ncbi:PQQ-dependent sugar dehydrogenase [Desulfohalovibrio reitneri]|uniref:PQQ-dependent sugar dehydrogenase n=1 Tax=Desulfohalovibrio reitneri TaxID=1307759 RepID=UPI0004A71310|nr:PQQ-dependent sugar dehydrogenase [Desulfohalovibrio reitneri]